MLKGSLDDFSLFDVFGLLERSGKSGELRLATPAGEGRVRVWHGKVSQADSDRGREPVGRKLVRAGAVTEPALRFALARRTDRDVPLGEALIRARLINPEQRAAVLREQIEEVVLDLFGSEPKHFVWTPDDEAHVPDVTVEVEGLLRDVSIRLERLSAIRRQIPDNRATVALQAVPPSHPPEIKVGTDQWQVLATLGSERAVADIVKGAGFDEFHVLDVLASLMDQGLIEIKPPTPSPTTERAPRSQPSTPSPPTERAPRSEPPAPPPPKAEPRAAEKAPPVPPPETGVRPGRQATKAAATLPAERRGAPFKIALVCTGNRIRSPLAEAFLTSFAPSRSLEISSVGLRDLGASGPLPEVVELAAELGVDVSRHRARSMHRGELSDADLVIGFEWLHVERAVTQGGAPRSRVFTLGELASLLEDVSPPGPADRPHETADRARGILSSIHELRLHRPPAAGAEMPDPLGGPMTEYRESAMRIRDLCRIIATCLFGSVPAGREPAAG